MTASQKTNTENWKGKLQERCQKTNKPMPTYETLVSGPLHCPLYTATVITDGKRFTSPDKHRRKVDAEQSAAQQAYLALSDAAAGTSSKEAEPTSKDDTRVSRFEFVLVKGSSMFEIGRVFVEFELSPFKLANSANHHSSSSTSPVRTPSLSPPLPDNSSSINASATATDSTRLSSDEALLTARPYQIEILQRALRQNTIACLPTGSGKTFIATMLIRELGHQLRDADNKRLKNAIFLVNTVPLALQQAAYLTEMTPFKVGCFYGYRGVDTRDLSYWKRVFSRKDVLVMTAGVYILLLRHGYTDLASVNLLVFDECHHCQKNHPFHMIMKEFYFTRTPGERPRVFGMTASPVGTALSKFDDEYVALENCKKQLRVLEVNIDSTVVVPDTINSALSLKGVMTVPDERIEYIPIGRYVTSDSRIAQAGSKFLAEVVQAFSRYGNISEEAVRQIAKFSRRITVELEELGPWCAHQAMVATVASLQRKAQAQTTYVLQKRHSPIGKNSVPDWTELSDVLRVAADRYTAEVLGTASSDAAVAMVTSHTSPRVSKLVEILTQYRPVTAAAESTSKSGSPPFCAIVFVKRRFAALALAHLINNHPQLRGWLKAAPLIGHGGSEVNDPFRQRREAIKGNGEDGKHDGGVTFSMGREGHIGMNFREQSEILRAFRLGRFNILVATRVAEEGLDIRPCRLVIRFDGFSQLVEYIQSRGRARHPASEYVVITAPGDAVTRDMMEKLCRMEQNLMEYYRARQRENLERQIRGGDATVDTHANDSGPLDGDADDVLFVETTGARVTGDHCVSLLFWYCNTLPADRYCRPMPYFTIVDTTSSGNRDLYICEVSMPLSAPEVVHYVRGKPSPNKLAARRSAALECCRRLRALGELDDHLRPIAMFAERNDGDELDDESDSEDGSNNNTNEGEVDNETLRPLPRRPCRRQRFPLPVPPQLQEPWRRTADNAGVRVAVHRIVVTYPRNAEGPTDSFAIEGAENYYILTPTALPTGLQAVQLYAKDAIGRRYSADAKLVASESEIEMSLEQLRLVALFNCRLLGFLLNAQSEFEQLPPESATAELLTGKLWNKHVIVAPRAAEGGIDWATVARVTANPDGQVVNQQFVIFKNRKYLVERVQDGRVVFGYHVSSTIPNLLRADQCGQLLRKDAELTELPLKQCTISPFVNKDLCSAAVIANMLWRFDRLLLARHWLDVVAQHCPAVAEAARYHDSRLWEQVAVALTVPRAAEEVNYERLETLGDSVLKLAVVSHLYHKYPHKHEGFLTALKGRMVSNRQLHNRGVERGLVGFMWNMAFSKAYLRAMLAPSFRRHLSKAPAPTQRGLARKSIADCVEALTGAFFEVGGPLAAIEFLCWLGVETSPWVRPPPSPVSKACYSGMYAQLTDLEKDLLRYEFRQKQLLIEAVTHSSCSMMPSADVLSMDPTARPASDYQRLEFLGDAVLDLLVTHHLFIKYPDCTPEVLSGLRSLAVSNNSLACVVVQYKLHRYIVAYSSALTEEISRFVEAITSDPNSSICDEDGNEVVAAPKVLGDIFEAILGAMFVDSGGDLATVWGVLQRMLHEHLEKRVKLENLKPSPEIQLRELVAEMNNSRGSFKVVKIAPTDVSAGDNAVSETEQLLFDTPIDVFDYRHVLGSVKRPRQNLRKVQVVLGDTVLGEGEGTSWKKARLRALANAIASLRTAQKQTAQT